MSRANVLVLVVRAGAGEALRSSVSPAGEDATVRVVAPASDLSRLDWLTNAEDDARAEAGQAADLVRADLDGTAGLVEVEVGDSDPLQAVEDALRTFPADELVIVDVPPEDPAWLERASFREGFERFGLPVRFVSTGAGVADGR